MAEEIMIESQLSRDRLVRGSVNEPVCASFRIQTSDVFARQNPTTFCDLILVVDTSGSMDEPFGQGQSMKKRDGAIQAAKEMVKLCKPKDRVSLICFDSNAYTEIEDVPASDINIINAGIDKISQHSGMTNFEAAFSEAHRLARKLKQPSKRIVFLTDGQSTSGKITVARSENDALAQMGVTVDCFGVGDDYKYSEMLAFTRVSNGESHHLTNPDDAKKLFSQSLKNAQQSLIQNAVLHLSVPSTFRDVEFYQSTPQQHDFSKPDGKIDGMYVYRIHLASLTQLNVYNFVMRACVDVPNNSAMNMLLAKLHLEYDVPVKNLKSVKADNYIYLSFSDSKDEELRRATVDDLYVIATLTKLQKELDAAIAQSQWQDAGRLLGEMCNRAKRVRRVDLVKEYEKIIAKLTANGKLTITDVNIGGQTTSKANSQMGIKQQGMFN